MNKSRWYPVIFFLTTALLITLPLFFKSGYLLLLDWAPVPHEAFFSQWSNVGVPMWALVWAMTSTFVSGIGQKIFVTTLFFLAGFGAYRMVPTKSVWARVVVGLLFQFNPFIYSRMLTGQLGHVIAFALLPWVIWAAGLWFDRMTWRRSIILGMLIAFVLWPSSHIGVMTVLMMVILGIAWCVWRIVRGRSSEMGNFLTWPKICLQIIVVMSVFIALNANWLVPLAIGRPGRDMEFVQNTVTDQHVFSFFTRSDPQHGVLWNVAAMYGFWGDDEWRYVPQKAIVPYWFWLLWALLAVVVWGFVVAIADSQQPIADSTATPSPTPPFGLRGTSRSPSLEEGEKIKEDDVEEDDEFLRSRAAAVAMALVGVLAFVAAVGVAHPWFKPGALWVYDHVPFARGFREPQKFVALLVLVYAFFAARGIEDLLARIDRLRHRRWWWFRLIAPGLFLLIPITYSPGLLWGFRGQLQPRQYPQSWSNADRFLAEDHDDARVIFLPWHMYINLSFAGTIINNPAERFFQSHPTIAGDNMEFGQLYSTSIRSESKVVEAILRNPMQHPWESAMELARINVKYVILPEESDFFNYTWLDDAGGFREVFKGDRIRVLLNEAWEK